jgi:hypothetical protein
MARRVNLSERIPVIQTLIRPLSDQPSKRMYPADSLDPNFLFEQLSPNCVHQVEIQGPDERRCLAVVNVISPYTPDMDVMVCDGTGSYCPTPSEMPRFEREALWQITQKIVAFMASNLPDRSIISVGYNNSPINIGSHEKGGLQSVISDHHVMVWDRTKEQPTKKFCEVPQNVQDYLTGDSYTDLAAQIVNDVIRHVSHPFLNRKSIRLASPSVHARLSVSLTEALADPIAMADFMDELHQGLEGANIAIWNAMVEKSYEEYLAIARTLFESPNLPQTQREYLLNQLVETAQLLPIEVRERNIRNLKKVGLSQANIDALLRINPHLQNREGIADTGKMFRKGFGFALVIVQDLTESTAKIIVQPAATIKYSQGGVVEAQRISLERIVDPQNGTAQQAVAENKRRLAELRETLPMHILRPSRPR